uniref:Uncharacterized protein n=1 Tax=Mycoplasma anserisalpingitidis TaxID=519450 RepID=A0A8F2IHX8_9MOLU|nr:hypothetical protein [Mycoplasma anserisalpingitidis]
MNKSKDIISIIDNIRNLGIGYIELIKNVNNDDLPDFNLLYKNLYSIKKKWYQMTTQHFKNYWMKIVIMILLIYIIRTNT